MMWRLAGDEIMSCTDFQERLPSIKKYLKTSLSKNNRIYSKIIAIKQKGYDIFKFEPLVEVIITFLLIIDHRDIE